MRKDEIRTYFRCHGHEFFNDISNFHGIKTQSRDPIYLCSFKTPRKDFMEFLEKNNFKIVDKLSESDVAFVRGLMGEEALSNNIPADDTIFAEDIEMLPAKILLIGKLLPDGVEVTSCVITL